MESSEEMEIDINNIKNFISSTVDNKNKKDLNIKEHLLKNKLVFGDEDKCLILPQGNYILTGNILRLKE
jgi:hypothetical protein